MFDKSVWRRFLKRKSSIIGSVILLFFFFGAIFGPLLCTQDPLGQDVANMHQWPSLEHWFGTDYLGRDIFTRIVYGARISLTLSFTAGLPREYWRCMNGWRRWASPSLSPCCFSPLWCASTR